MRFLSLACLFLSTQAFAADPPRARKVVLIAGPMDGGHPAGTHEYEKTVRVFKHCLDTAANVKGLRVEAHLGGWPEKPATLDDADTIVFVSSGSDRKEADHPLLVGERLAVIEKQMKRGCGLAMIHWSTFTPKKTGTNILEWVGGYFDYESGPAKNGWYSKIQTVTVKAVPGRHPITSGMAPFEAKDEFYYNLRFRERDPRLVPILSVPMAKEGEQVVAWAVERANGDFVRTRILDGTVRACHDVSDGGLLVAIAEMALASGVGVRLSTHPRDVPGHAFWFGEDQARYLIAVPDSASVLRAAEQAGIPAMRIGTSGGKDLTLPDGGTISIAELRTLHERFFPAWMAG